MKKLTLIALAGLSALTFASCTCSACGGSGLQTIKAGTTYKNSNGKMENIVHDRTITCVPCNGTGKVDWLRDVRGVIKAGKDATELVEGVQNVTGHGNRR